MNPAPKDPSRCFCQPLGAVGSVAALNFGGGGGGGAVVGGGTMGTEGWMPLAFSPAWGAGWRGAAFVHSLVTPRMSSSGSAGADRIPQLFLPPR